MLTSGLQTETLATDTQASPVASETCCTTKARIPAIANAYASQLVRTAPNPSSPRISAARLAGEADRP